MKAARKVAQTVAHWGLRKAPRWAQMKAAPKEAQSDLNWAVRRADHLVVCLAAKKVVRLVPETAGWMAQLKAAWSAEYSVETTAGMLDVTTARLKAAAMAEHWADTLATRWAAWTVELSGAQWVSQWETKRAEWWAAHSVALMAARTDCCSVEWTAMWSAHQLVVHWAGQLEQLKASTKDSHLAARKEQL